MQNDLTLRQLLRGSVLVLALAGVVSPAGAQSRGRPRAPQQTQPAPQTQPGQQAAAPAPTWDDLLPSPFIERTRPKRWTIQADMRIAAAQAFNPDGTFEHDTWSFDSATFIYPVAPETASSILEVWGPPDAEIPAVKGYVEVGDNRVTDEVSMLTQGIGGGPLPCGTWRAQWQVPRAEQGVYVTREFEFQVVSSQVCYQTRWVDERAASQVGWPKGEWPPDAAATFQPQMFVEFDSQLRGYDMSPVTALLDKWTGGRSVEQVRDQSRPVVLAKWLAGQVVQHVQPQGEGLLSDDTGLWMGFDLRGAPAAAVEGRGTELDLPCLLVAMYRAVGLPSRLVIGYDEDSKTKGRYLKEGKGGGDIRVWVEFALYDETNRTFGWVPVDVTAIRRQQSTLPDNYLSRDLKFFGSHDELDRVIPLGFHFHPPTSVRAYGAPALWGCFVTPTPPSQAVQQVSLSMTTTPSGGSNPSHLPAQRQK